MKTASPAKVTEAGGKALVLLHGGNIDDCWNTLRHVNYIQKLSACASVMEPYKLPPSSSAAKFHCLRAYFQVQALVTLKEWHDMDSTERDWENKQGLLLPV